jgi:hypothetical protein
MLEELSADPALHAIAADVQERITRMIDEAV